MVFKSGEIFRYRGAFMGGAFVVRWLEIFKSYEVRFDDLFQEDAFWYFLMIDILIVRHHMLVIYFNFSSKYSNIYFIINILDKFREDIEINLDKIGWILIKNINNFELLFHRYIFTFIKKYFKMIKKEEFLIFFYYFFTI